MGFGFGSACCVVTKHHRSQFGSRLAILSDCSFSSFFLVNMAPKQVVVSPGVWRVQLQHQLMCTLVLPGRQGPHLKVAGVTLHSLMS